MSERVNPIFAGKVTNGKIILDTESLKKRLEQRLLSLEGQKIQLSIQKRRNRRSLDQNSYYWGAILPIIADQTGMLDEEVHEALKLRFLIDHTKKIPTIKSTSDLSKGEFVEYLMNITQWGSEFLGIEKWPNPDEWDQPQLI